MTTREQLPFVYVHGLQQTRARHFSSEASFVLIWSPLTAHQILWLLRIRNQRALLVYIIIAVHGVIWPLRKIKYIQTLCVLKNPNKKTTLYPRIPSTFIACSFLIALSKHFIIIINMSARLPQMDQQVFPAWWFGFLFIFFENFIESWLAIALHVNSSCIRAALWEVKRCDFVLRLLALQRCRNFMTTLVMNGNVMLYHVTQNHIFIALLWFDCMLNKNITLMWRHF